MNTFEIRIVDSVSEGGGPFKEIRPLIDGRDLIDRLKDFEEPFARREGAPGIAGGYSGLSAAHTPKGRWLGLCDRDYGDHGGKVAVLQCRCGCDGCWPFAVTITVTDTTVQWSDFEQPHRSTVSPQAPWDYSGFGPFEFRKDQYERELGKLDGFLRPTNRGDSP